MIQPDVVAVVAMVATSIGHVLQGAQVSVHGIDAVHKAERLGLIRVARAIEPDKAMMWKREDFSATSMKCLFAGSLSLTEAGEAFWIQLQQCWESWAASESSSRSMTMRA